MGMTPPYLDPGCHEALFEVDVGIYAYDIQAPSWSAIPPSSSRDTGSSQGTDEFRDDFHEEAQ